MWGVVAVAGPETCQGGDQDKPATIFTPPSLGHNCELRACHRSFSSSTDDALAAAAFILVYTLLYTYRKEEPEVSNRKEQATTNGGSKAAATTTANPKMDAEPRSPQLPRTTPGPWLRGGRTVPTCGRARHVLSAVAKDSGYCALLPSFTGGEGAV